MRKLLCLAALVSGSLYSQTFNCATSPVDACSQAVSATGASSLTWTHTTGAGLVNSQIIVGLSYYNNTPFTQSASTITCGSQSLTKIIRQNNGLNGATGELWYYANPTAGACTITVTMSASIVNGILGAAMTVSGFNAVPEVSTAVGSVNVGAAQTTHSDTITTVANNAWVVDMVTVGNGAGSYTPNLTVLGTQTSRILTALIATSWAGGMSTFQQPTAGGVSIGWNFASTGATVATAHVVASFAPAQTISTASYVPVNQTGWTLYVNGVNTTWTPGTPGTPTFSVSGVAGVSITAQQVISSTVTKLTLATGNSTGTLTVSDATNSTTTLVASPGISMTWAGPRRYDDFGGNTSNGDTWIMMDTVNGIRMTCNDCTCANATCNSNIGFMSETFGPQTVTFINAMAGLGISTEQGKGYCTSLTFKSSAPISYNGLYVLPVACQTPARPFTDSLGSMILSTSTDDGARWARVQDTYLASAGSWSATVATLTTATQSFSTGDRVIVMGCTPSTWNSLPAIATVLTGSDATHVNYTISSNPGSYVSGCVVIGPATAAVPAPTGTSMWPSGGMVRRYYAQICTDNVGCTATPDGTSTYLVGIGTNGDSASQQPVAFRVLKTDFDLTPGDKTKYQYWVSGSTWSSTLASGSAPTCIVNGTASACTDFGSNIFYITDSILPDGGVYMAVKGASQINGRISWWGSQEVWYASNIYGPWYLALYPSVVDSAKNPPVAYNFTNSVPSQYTRLSATPYVGQLCFQFGGSYLSDYVLYSRCALISIRDVNNSSLFSGHPRFTTATFPYRHVTSGLVAMWRMRVGNDLTTIKDDSNTGSTILMSGQNGGTSGLIATESGMWNPNSALNASWETVGGVWNLPTTFGNAVLGSGDLSTLAVFSTTASGTQYIMGGTTAGSVGFSWKVVGAALHFLVRNGASIDVTCPGTLVAGTFAAYIGVRSGAVGYCYVMGTAAPASAGSDSASLGTYTLALGSPFGIASNYFNGIIGEIGIWNRALCSTQISTCAIDEVQLEFAAVKRESATRGWGF